MPAWCDRIDPNKINWVVQMDLSDRKGLTLDVVGAFGSCYNRSYNKNTKVGLVAFCLSHTNEMKHVRQHLHQIGVCMDMCVRIHSDEEYYSWFPLSVATPWYASRKAYQNLAFAFFIFVGVGTVLCGVYHSGPIPWILQFLAVLAVSWGYHSEHTQ